MSLKKPYLDVRGLSSQEAYTLISESMEKQLYYKDKKSFPPYRCKQILNAITHASLTEEQKSELKGRLQQLRAHRNELPSDLKALNRAKQDVQKRELQQRSVQEVAQREMSKESEGHKPIQYSFPSNKTNAINLKYVGRFRNFKKKILALKSNDEAIALYDKFVDLDFSVNEMQSVLNFCNEVLHNQAIGTLALNVKNRLKREEEKMQKNTEAFIKKMKSKPRKPFVTILYTPQGGQNKRY